jgi:hypothetical protein
MNISEPQSSASEADRENVIQALKDWRAKEPSKGVALRNSHTHPSIIRRVFRIIAFGFIAVFIALAVVVWQSGSQEIGKVVSAFQVWLTRSLSNTPSATPIGSTKAPAVNTAVSQGTPPPATSQPTEEDLSAIKRQIEAMTNQLTEVRHIVEQLAANQEKMGQDFAVLKVDEESINKRLAAVSAHSGHSPNASAAPRKKPQGPAQSGVSGRSSSEPRSVGAPLPLR